MPDATLRTVLGSLSKIVNRPSCWVQMLLKIHSLRSHSYSSSTPKIFFPSLLPALGFLWVMSQYDVIQRLFQKMSQCLTQTGVCEKSTQYSPFPWWTQFSRIILCSCSSSMFLYSLICTVLFLWDVFWLPASYLQTLTSVINFSGELTGS